MSYDRDKEAEIQVLYFEGTFADGTKLAITRKCPAHAHLETESVAAAHDAIKIKENSLK